MVGVKLAAERFKCPHCRRKFRIGSEVAFYPADPDWKWGCRECGSVYVDVLASASARNSADQPSSPELDWEGDWSRGAAAAGNAVADDAEADVDYSAD